MQIPGKNSTQILIIIYHQYLRSIFVFIRPHQGKSLCYNAIHRPSFLDFPPSSSSAQELSSPISIAGCTLSMALPASVLRLDSFPESVCTHFGCPSIKTHLISISGNRSIPPFWPNRLILLIL